jgi:hypothetical protein
MLKHSFRSRSSTLAAGEDSDSDASSASSGLWAEGGEEVARDIWEKHTAGKEAKQECLEGPRHGQGTVGQVVVLGTVHGHTMLQQVGEARTPGPDEEGGKWRGMGANLSGAVLGEVEMAARRERQQRLLLLLLGLLLLVGLLLYIVLLHFMVLAARC